MSEAIQAILTTLQRIAERVFQVVLSIGRILIENLPLAAVVGVLGAFLVYWLRARDERRAEHLAELRGDVLERMLGYIDDHVLPVLEHRVGNVGFCRRQIPSPNLAEGSSFEEVFCLQEASEVPLSYHHPYPTSELPASPEGPLVQDARRHHFPRLIRNWDEVVGRFDEYNNACLRYVESLRARIAEDSALPEYSLQSRESKWVNAATIALIIFYQQVGLPTFEFTFKQGGGLVYKGFTLVEGTVGEVHPVRAHLERLMAQRNRIEELISTARVLKVDVDALRVAFEDQRLRRRLRGKCPYV